MVDDYTKSIECLCVKTTDVSMDGALTMGTRLNVDPGSLTFSANINMSMNTDNVRVRTMNISVDGEGTMAPKLSVFGVLTASPSIELTLGLDPTMLYGVSFVANLSLDTSISYADKYSGDFGDYECAQKLYPIADRTIDSVYGHFVGPHGESSGLYDFIDEGVFTGDYDDKNSPSNRLADDKGTFIHPSATHTIGQWQYKCEVSAPIIRPEETRLRLRASAPMSNVEVGTPPRYTISGIRLEDPNGDLIVEYDPIVLRGDADYYDQDYVNFTTYSTNAMTNNTVIYHGGEDGYPSMQEGSGYTLTFNVVAEALDDAFDDGFTTGFEENRVMHDPYGSGNDHMAFDGAAMSDFDQSFMNPTHALKISALEICNSGGRGPGIDNAVNFYAQVRATGNRIERTLFPSLVPTSDFSTTIFPDVTSVWVADGTYTNETVLGSKRLLTNIKTDSKSEYITMQSSTIHDSGKLTLKITHGGNRDELFEITPGAFDAGFDGKSASCISDGAFNRESKNADDMPDHFFDVECVKLRVLAKKEVGSRDYYLDVVGYSDDKLLNITSASGGFLQNISGGSGTHPTSSGFMGDGEIPFAGNAMSDDDDYFETSGNAGGDHFLLTTSPVVSGLGFEWYEIPLEVYDDQGGLGVSRDYSLSSMFEKLYLDIYPIPSGASIAKVELLVRYKPQTALNITTEGGADIRKATGDRDETKIFPTGRGSGDDIINAGSGYGPLSTISNIPQAYTTPNTIKTNYSRRWRGMDGVNTGPFDPDQFDFSWDFSTVDSPFMSGYYNFEDDTDLTIKPAVGSLSGYMTTNLSPYRFKNLGWRFQSNDIFTGYTSAYKTIDWSATTSGATDFEDHPLYGQIADASRNFIRLKGNDSYVNFGDIGTSGSLSAYIRFSPDIDVSGVGYDLFQSGCLFSKWDAGKNLEFALHYASGYLRGIARDTSGVVHSVQDSTPYTDYQFPLSVILTYSGGLHLYTDNEFEPNWDVMRDSGSAFTMHVDDSDFIVGNSPGSGVGFNMFVSEIGLSEHANIVSGVADKTDQQVSAETYLGNNRVFWWDIGETYTNDAFKIWQNIDEDTRVDWALGAFKFCQFDSSFDIISKRTGRDIINFNLTHDGVGYITNADLAMPSNVDSGVAYHTQIENDFLRFNLSDTDTQFYSVLRRISKDLPRGYKFAEDALVVETIIEHESSGDIVWPDGSIGPKLIVSLYTKTKDPYWTPDEPNWGLINRDIHYLEPATCMIRLDSKFTYESICDETEQWALFPSEPRLSEFSEKYFSEDVDDMFLQYDLVYPSGPPFASRLDIHSAHVRMDNAYVTKATDTDQLNVSTSGGFVVDENLNLVLHNTWEPVDGQVNLYTFGPIQLEESGVPFYTSGAIILPAELNMFTESREVISVSGLNIVTSGKPLVLDNASGTVNLHTLGKGIITSASGDQLGMALTALNIDDSNLPDAGLLNMFTFAPSGGFEGIRTTMPIFMLNSQPVVGSGNDSLNLRTIGSSALFSRYKNGTMNLSITNDEQFSTNEMNLTLYGDNLSTTVSSGSMNLYVANYSGPNTPGEVGGPNEPAGSNYFRWFNNNFGTAIDLIDNDYAQLAANDEIRGVDTIGYGSCTGNSPDTAVDPAIVTDDTTWREETCNEGGIMRGETTYTNGDASYSGNYYGIRKYTELLPHSPYFATMKIVTGSTDSIRIPDDFEEWEYGVTDDVTYEPVKMVADSPETVSPSGRNAGDKYGKTVAVKGDLMAVGSPFMSIADASGEAINDAGSVFLYRRGADVAGEQAAWGFEDQILLPSGYRRDYISASISNLLCYPNTTNPQFCVSGQRWNIGQEGREFGHAIDIANSGDTETLVIGAPGASWNRTFDTINPVSGIPVTMVIFTDKFTYNEDSIGQIANIARKYDVLYTYFSAPWNAGADEFQPRLDVNLLVCQIVFSDDPQPIVESEYDWFNHVYINRLDDIDLLEEMSVEDIENSMASGVEGAFVDSITIKDAPHSGIPPIIGIFRDNTFSTRRTAAFAPVANRFESFYENLAELSGVVDPETGLPENGYINTISAPSEAWQSATIDILNDTISTGNLTTNSALKYITSGVGQQWANNDAYQFQMPAPSGGRVFIYEKESGVFNLVQEIKSTAERSAGFSFSNDGDEDHFIGYGSQHNDRFGHSVSISQDAEVITIGSPYSATPFEVFEKDPNESVRMYDNLRAWFVFRSKVTQTNRYDQLVTDSGVDIAKRVSYNEMDAGDKFFFRGDELYWGENPIEIYKSIYTYNYGSIPFRGTWSFIPDEYAGTSRIGYSTAVSEDGDTVAFGAPTDSFNEFDDNNIWFKGYDTWASYVNAGAVRVFESRKYYPHSGVVEYYKFGNMDRTLHPELVDQGYYDQMGLYFDDDNPFTRTQFDDLEIPQDAGLAFIITPEVDASSDEIIQNIKDWMSLGDRTLVLVGNDPVWEEGGAYKQSNDIVNTILQKLGSRMRLHPARTEYESLPDQLTQEQVAADKFNVLPAKQPAYSHGSIASRGSVFAHGVADIRIDLTDLGITGTDGHAPCDALNSRCEMPLVNDGDLRAEWNAECTKTVGNVTLTISYKENWPRRYGNTNPSEQCDEPPIAPINRPNQDITPVLTAAECIPASSYIVPESSGLVTTITPIYETRTITTTEEYKEFAENQDETVAFSIFADADDSTITGDFDYFSAGTFFDPEAVTGIGDVVRDGIVQATGDSYFLPPELSTRKVSDISDVMTEEIYYDGDNATTSYVYLMANVTAGDKDNMGYSNVPTSNDDQNIAFFNNLIMSDCLVKGSVVQIGGWTGRTDYTGVLAASKITQAWDSYEQTDHEENKIYTAGDSISVSHNVVWISAPTGIPSTSDINMIKEWLETGEKRLVITYDNNQQIADNVTYICDQLGLLTKPWYSDSQAEYLVQGSLDIEDDGQILGNQTAFTGCTGGYGWENNDECGDYCSTAVDEVDLTSTPYIPIRVGEHTNRMLYYGDRLYEEYYEVPEQRWRIDAAATGDVTVVDDTGYRIFIDYVSETPDERTPMTVFFDNMTNDPDGSSRTTGIVGTQIPSSTTYIVEKKQIDCLSLDTDVSFRITSRNPNIPEAELNGGLPKTPRIISISGCPLAINTFTETTTRTITVEVGQTIEEHYEVSPEYEVTIPSYLRPIMTYNDKYCEDDCDKGGQLIQDGPVVVAEEFEHFSSFSAGNQRSRIILVSDSTILQGQLPHYRNDATSENQRLIRSFYPLSPYPILGNNGDRRFEEVQKLLSPERGSPAKYYAASSLAGNVSRFGGVGVAGSLGAYTDTENDLNPADVSRPLDPRSPEAIKEAVEDFGNTTIPNYGPYPRFSGAYVDAGRGGGIPAIMRATGRDHLDLDVYFSGYPGDLFGYDISLHKNKLIVGSPFAAYHGETISPWEKIEESGASALILSGNGGAGAAYYFERTGSGVNSVTSSNPWQFMEKIQPDSIHSGIDNATISSVTNIKGAHNMGGDFVINNAHLTDQFGQSVSIDADMVAIGAPNHDYETIHQYLYDSGAFLRKAFNAEFDIMTHDYYDLGNSGIRVDDFGGASGKMVINNGAVFTYRHKVVDWQNRTKEWRFAEKINARGYADRNDGPSATSGTENDFFGKSVYLDRARRGDGDYTLAIGSQGHKYATSGNHSSSQPLGNAGAAYVFDAMLRGQTPVIPNSGGWIEAEVFGDRAENGLNRLHQRVYQNTEGGPITYEVSGIVFSNINGDVFIEVSGYDPSTRGFIAHRPYIESVIGEIMNGTQTTGSLNLGISGIPASDSGTMNLSMLGPDSAIVYNNVNLFTTAWNQINVGSGNTPVYIYVSGEVPASGSNQMNMLISGTLLSSESLHARIRGN